MKAQQQAILFTCFHDSENLYQDLLKLRKQLHTNGVRARVLINLDHTKGYLYITEGQIIKSLEKFKPGINLQ